MIDRLQNLTLEEVREFIRLSAAASEHERAVSERHGLSGRLYSVGELLAVPPEEWECEASAKISRLARALDEPGLIELTALMWYGRGDDELAQCREHAGKTSRGAGEVEYVLGKPLWRYLPAALAKLDKTGE